MHEPTRTPWDDNGQLEVLIFDLQEETFALEAMLVREIVNPLPDALVAGAMPLVASVVNCRGKVISVAELLLAFDMPHAETTVDNRIVVIETGIGGETMQIGIRAEKVREVATLHRGAGEPPPAIGMRWRRDFIRELVRKQGSAIVLPDILYIFQQLTGGSDPAAPSIIH